MKNIINDINQETKTYIIGTISATVGIFIISAVIFMFLIADKLDIIMSQNPKITYTYFIFIMDRILLLATLFYTIPLTIVQITSKNKKNFDKSVSIVSILLLIGTFLTIFAGQYNFFQNYKNGELKNSIMFSTPSIETKIFDKILN